MAIVKGIVKLSQDGKKVISVESPKYNIGVDQKTSEIASDRTLLTSISPTIAYVEVTTVNTSESDIEELLEADGVTVILELGVGVTYSWKDCHIESEGEIEADGGKVTIKYVSPEKAVRI